WPAGWHLRSRPDRTSLRDHHGSRNRRHTHVTNRSHADRGRLRWVLGPYRVRPGGGPICRRLSTGGVILQCAADRDLLQPISGILPPAGVLHFVLPTVVLSVVLHALGELLCAPGVTHPP